ncbi:MAG: DUF456 domain-containing protein [Nocardioidaceae bacterium]
MNTAMEILVGAAIVVGLLGIVLPVLPGALLVWAAVLVWALELQTTSAWVALGVATVAIAVSQVVKYLVPHRQLRTAAVPRRSIIVGGVLGVVGFFVIPIVGLVLGFVFGIYAAERRRLGSHDTAWTSTKTAMRVVGISILIELAGALVAAGTWFGVAVST